MRLQSKNWLLMAFLPLFTILFVSFFEQAFAQETSEGYIQRNAVIWKLFYDLMIAAFAVGAVVNAVIIYIVWRYRESHPRQRFARVAEEAEGGIGR
jgi:heme/copper-type cytochrome/quinol oxidase subunit 2